MKRTRSSFLATVTAASALLIALGTAQAEELRLLTWAGYAPDDVVAKFEKETGIEVEVTLSNNEEMISKLRATGGAGFDLAQPSQDRITGPQAGIRHLQADGPVEDQDRASSSRRCWKPPRRTPRWTARSTACRTSGAPTAWCVNTKLAADVRTTPTCASAEVKGKNSVRLKRPTLLAFAFSDRQGPVRALWRPQGLRGADGRRSARS